MTRIEILEEIIRQDGDCKGIDCEEDKCPFCTVFGACSMCGNNEKILKVAEKILVLEKNKEEPKFEAGSEVKWNGRKDNLSYFDAPKEEFLKSRKIHTITVIYGSSYCELEDSGWLYKLDWFDLVGGEKDE